MSIWIPSPILVVLSQGGAGGAGLYQPDKEKRIQHGCDRNTWEESVQGWTRQAMGYSRDPLMGSGRFSAKATLLLEDILRKQFDWVVLWGAEEPRFKMQLSYSLANLWLVTAGQNPHICSSQQLLISRVAVWEFAGHLVGGSIWQLREAACDRLSLILYNV